MTVTELTLTAADGQRLAATWTEPAGGRARALVVMAPALGVPRGFYGAFGAYLAEGGLGVLSVDCRGVGGSCVGSLREGSASLWTWARQDLAAALAHVVGESEGRPVCWVGHSMGGQLFGLVPGIERVERALLLGAASGYWRLWSGWRRWGMAALWHGVVPALSGALGYLPMRVFGQGEDLPGGVAREWAAWGRRRDYVAGVARERGVAGYASWSGRLRALAFTDDRHAPPASVRAMASAFAAAEREVEVLSPSDLGLESIGHFGALRPRAGERLWPRLRGWLVA